MRHFETSVDGDMTTSYFADDEGNLTINKVQDVRPTLQWAREIRDAGAHGKDGRHVASVPVTILNDIRKIHGVDYLNKEDLPKVMAIIQRDYSAFCTGKM